MARSERRCAVDVTYDRDPSPTGRGSRRVRGALWLKPAMSGRRFPEDTSLRLLSLKTLKPQLEAKPNVELAGGYARVVSLPAGGVS